MCIRDSSKGCDFRIENPEYVKLPGKLGMEFVLKGSYNIKLAVGSAGLFSCSNAAACAAVCRELGISDDAVSEGLRTCLLYTSWKNVSKI